MPNDSGAPRLTKEHAMALAYWRSSVRIRGLFDQPPSVDALINAHAGINNTAADQNTLALVQLRRNGGRTDEDALSPSSWDQVQVPKRYARLRRWLRRLRGARARRPTAVAVAAPKP